MSGFADVRSFGATGTVLTTLGTFDPGDPLDTITVADVAGWSIGAGIGIAEAVDGTAALVTRVVDVLAGTRKIRLRDAAGVRVSSVAVASDDTEPIQDAIDSLGSEGGAVFLPAGTYVIGTPGASTNHPLFVGNHIRMVGAGRGATILRLARDVRQAPPGFPTVPAAILVTNRGNPWWFSGNEPNLAVPPADEDIEVAHLSLDGNKDEQATLFSPTDGVLIEASETGLYLDQASRCYVHDVEIADCAIDGLVVAGPISGGLPAAGVRESAFETVWIHGCGRVGVAVTGAVSSVRFAQCWMDDNLGGGCDIEPSFPGLPMQDVSFLHCRFKGSSRPGALGVAVGPFGPTAEFPQGSPLDNLSFLDCEFDGNLVGLGIRSASGGVVTNCRIVGSVFRRQLNTACGISAAGHGVMLACVFDQNSVPPGAGVPGAGEASQLLFEYPASSWRVIGNYFRPCPECCNSAGIEIRAGLEGDIGRIAFLLSQFRAGDRDQAQRIQDLVPTSVPPVPPDIAQMILDLLDLPAGDPGIDPLYRSIIDRFRDLFVQRVTGLVIVGNNYQSIDGCPESVFPDGRNTQFVGATKGARLADQIIHSNSGDGEFFEETSTDVGHRFDLSTTPPLPDGAPGAPGLAGRGVQVLQQPAAPDTATSKVVRFSVPLARADYQVMVSPRFDSGGWFVTDQTAEGFTINWARALQADGVLDWTVSA